MPLITPSIQPPLSDLSNSSTERKVFLEDIPKPTSNPPQQSASRTDAPESTNHDSSDGGYEITRIPRVRLDVDVIPDIMAAKLATSLLGHVLFLKNQIPFPVLQLTRLPSGKSNARAAKLKRDLIDSFDTLSSHLDTTFTALSTAFARSSSISSSSVSEPGGIEKPSSQAYMAILVGPSIGTPKSKVILALDGLETKVWGMREDIPSSMSDEGAEASDEEDDENGSADSDEETSEPEDSDDLASEPEESDSESSKDDENDDDFSDHGRSSPIPLSPPSPPPRPQYKPAPSSSVPTYAQEQQRIRAADQLLSRTLAIADAEGRGMASEIAPTQTHVLLLAPRRFSHPAWVPRPNFTNSMDNTLNDFLEEAGMSTASPDDSRKSKRPQKQTVEGVLVSGKAPTQMTPAASDAEVTSHATENKNEDDEMIWWSWDGKIVGFSSW